MDNVTHSLAGLLLAECTIRLRARRSQAEPSPRFRTVAAVSSMIAANLPDADLFYTGFGGDRIRYMLHHRGYSHTVVIAIVGALLLWYAATLTGRRRGRLLAREAPARDDARWLLGLLLVSTLSHLVLDWTNSYGVHVFWPIDNRWRYGDAMFIVEPWLWVVAVPALVAASTRWVTRVLLSLVLLAGLALAWRVDLVAAGAAAALTAGAALFVALARVLRPGGRAIAAVSGWVVVTFVMMAGTSEARATAIRAVRDADSTAELLDVVVSPLPANPVCATVITVERDRAVYRIATARVSAVPSLARAISCSTRATIESMIAPSTRRSTRSVHWEGEWSAPIAALSTLVHDNCVALAAMRFIRVPIWRTLADSAVVLGDARFGGASGNGFTDVRVARPPAACPAAVPPWRPPRADLLGR
jgi:inner membrane protein